MKDNRVVWQGNTIDADFDIDKLEAFAGCDIIKILDYAFCIYLIEKVKCDFGNVLLNVGSTKLNKNICKVASIQGAEVININDDSDDLVTQFEQYKDVLNDNPHVGVIIDVNITSMYQTILNVIPKYSDVCILNISDRIDVNSYKNIHLKSVCLSAFTDCDNFLTSIKSNDYINKAINLITYKRI